MLWLLIGVLLWSCAHLFPSAGASTRARLIERVGEGPYMGGFALTILVSVALMVLGWRSAVPAFVYAPPAWGATAALPLMFAALLSFAASGAPSNIKRVLRHPQLSGVAAWAAAHLLANGDQRSLVLFGGLGVWAILAMLSINRRDGAWERPDPAPMTAEVRPMLAAIVIFAVLFFAHPYVAGVALMY